MRLTGLVGILTLALACGGSSTPTAPSATQAQAPSFPTAPVCAPAFGQLTGTQTITATLSSSPRDSSFGPTHAAGTWTATVTWSDPAAVVRFDVFDYSLLIQYPPYGSASGSPPVITHSTQTAPTQITACWSGQHDARYTVRLILVSGTSQDIRLTYVYPEP